MKKILVLLLLPLFASAQIEFHPPSWRLNGNTLTGNTSIGAKNNYALLFITDNVERARILGTGAVVIGHTVTAIGEKLGIRTASNSYGWTHTDGTINLTSYVGSSAGWLGTQSNHSLNLFYNDQTATATIGTLSNMDITATRGMLIGPNDVFVCSNRFRIGTGTSTALFHGADALSTGYVAKFRNNGASDADNILVIQNNKMVGINTGTATVTEELEVVGNIKMVDGGQAANKAMISNDLGVASWQTITSVGTVTTGAWNGTAVGVQYGGTGANLSATGGASQVLQQTSAGGAITVGQLAATDLSNGTAGTGSVVLSSNLPQVATFTANTTTTSTVATAATGYTFNIGANTTYVLSGAIQGSCDNTGGCKYYLDMPGTSTVTVSYNGTTSSSSSVNRVSQTTDATLTGIAFITYNGGGTIEMDGKLVGDGTGGVAGLYVASATEGQTCVVAGWSNLIIIKASP